MTGGSNIDKSSLVYKIEDFYQTFEVFERQSVGRWVYRASLFSLGFLFLISMLYTFFNILSSKEHFSWLAITLFLELIYLSVNESYQRFMSKEKLKILRVRFACSYNDIEKIKSLWFENNFSMGQPNILGLIRDIDYLLDVSRRLKLSKREFDRSVFGYIYNREAKNRILALIGVLVTVTSLFITQLLIISNPPDFQEVFNFLFSSSYMNAVAHVFGLVGMLLWFLKSSKQSIYVLIERIINTDILPSKNFHLELTQYKSKFLIKYLIRIAHAQSKKNN